MSNRAMSQGGGLPTRITVNGSVYQRDIPARLSLADWLRDDLGLTGTHLGCEQGVCGACTVLMDGQPVRSCLLFAVQANDCEVETIEGVARVTGELHPVQRAFVERHGLQCGFCTPGFVMAALSFFASRTACSREEMARYFSGNICRCTGYRKIVEALEDAANGLNVSISE